MPSPPHTVALRYRSITGEDKLKLGLQLCRLAANCAVGKRAEAWRPLCRWSPRFSVPLHDRGKLENRKVEYLTRWVFFPIVPAWQTVLGASFGSRPGASPMAAGWAW